MTKYLRLVAQSATGCLSTLTKFNTTALGHAAREDYFPAEDLTPDTDNIDPRKYDPDYGDLDI